MFSSVNIKASEVETLGAMRLQPRFCYFLFTT